MLWKKNDLKKCHLQIQCLNNRLRVSCFREVIFMTENLKKAQLFQSSLFCIPIMRYVILSKLSIGMFHLHPIFHKTRSTSEKQNHP